MHEAGIDPDAQVGPHRQRCRIGQRHEFGEVMEVRGDPWSRRLAKRVVGGRVGRPPAEHQFAAAVFDQPVNQAKPPVHGPMLEDVGRLNRQEYPGPTRREAVE